jgi:hypothetical protein
MNVTYALRTLPGHPSGITGDLIPLRYVTDPDQAERIRQEFTGRYWLEVVQLDENGNPV